MNDLLRSLGLSLQISFIATMVTAVLAIPLAFFLARKKFVGKSLIEAIFTLPLVMPPTVVGYFLVVLLGVNGWIGRWLNEWFGLRLIFDWRGAVIAAVVVSFPLLFLPAKAAFASIERELEDIATLMGAGPLRIFWHVSLPLARRGIVSGLLLAFARALGEFGATVMIFGDISGHQTLPISIYSDYTSGRSLESSSPTWMAVTALSVVSLLVILVYNRATALSRE
jgi:molybdate transport system permease protein